MSLGNDGWIPFNDTFDKFCEQNLNNVGVLVRTKAHITPRLLGHVTTRGAGLCGCYPLIEPLDYVFEYKVIYVPE